MFITKKQMIEQLETALHDLKDPQNLSGVSALALLSVRHSEGEGTMYEAVVYGGCPVHAVPDMLLPQRMLSITLDKGIEDNVRRVADETSGGPSRANDFS